MFNELSKYPRSRIIVIQMKQKVSVSLDEKTLEEVDRKLVSATFRNRSHLVEYAVKRLLGEEK